jgi:hypothetical protein
VSDTPEEKARRQKLLQEIWELEEQMGLENEQLTIDEIVKVTKQVRKELAEERIKGEQK